MRSIRSEAVRRSPIGWIAVTLSGGAALVGVLFGVGLTALILMLGTPFPLEAGLVVIVAALAVSAWLKGRPRDRVEEQGSAP
ncbi:MAG: hypothetical protein AB7J28_04740 [Hyphomonadaceae bacterium]